MVDGDNAENAKYSKGTEVAQFLKALPWESGERREDVLTGKFDSEEKGE